MAQRNVIVFNCQGIFDSSTRRPAVCKDSLHTATDGKKYKTKLYNLDVIISVGYRVKSSRGTQFRIWANKVLKKYCLKEHAFSTVANFATVEKAGGGQVRRLVEYSRIAGV